MYKENPCATLLTIQDRMRHISNVADVYFRPTNDTGKYQAVFADGQIVSFDSYTVDWEQLERTCKYWNRKIIIRQLAKAIKGVRESWKQLTPNKSDTQSGFGSFHN